MPKLKHRIKPSPLGELRSERAQAEEWLRGAVEDFIERPKAGRADYITENLPRYRAAFMRVRQAERKGTRG
jgi:hypothetical protein